jgi:hypothetical protein
MSLGQSGEVDKRQSTRHTPPEALEHRHQLAQTFFWFDLRKNCPFLAGVSKYTRFHSVRFRKR